MATVDWNADTFFYKVIGGRFWNISMKCTLCNYDLQKKTKKKKNIKQKKKKKKNNNNKHIYERKHVSFKLKLLEN